MKKSRSIALVKRLLLAGVLIASFLPAAGARMVSYRGGVTFMTFNDRNANSTFIHYSPSASFSVGHLNEYNRGKEFWIEAVQVTGLRRWNRENDQANAYLFGALGGAVEGGGESRAAQPALLGGFSLDWENRRYYVSFSGRETYADGFTESYEQKIRVGIAPYVGGYGDLHTWLMLQVDHRPGDDDEWTLTPLVRLFKGTNLLEAGMDLEGRALLNFVHVF